MFLILVDCEQDDKITTTSLHGRNYPRENKIVAKKYFNWATPRLSQSAKKNPFQLARIFIFSLSDRLEDIYSSFV